MGKKVLTSLKSNNVNFENLAKLVGYVMGIPESDAHIERVFSLMNNKWTEVRNGSNTNLIKSELQVAMHFPYSYSELHEFVKNNIKLLTEAKSVAIYRMLEV
ncbi:hypothetical protein C0J52_09388 [Blattella germanica]|nr:hypothetical protein C0J52_09388 [Blattella germanica]